MFPVRCTLNGASAGTSFTLHNEPITAQGVRCHLSQRPGSRACHQTARAAQMGGELDRNAGAPQCGGQADGGGGARHSLARAASGPAREMEVCGGQSSRGPSKHWASGEDQQEEEELSADWPRGDRESHGGVYLRSSTQAVLHLYLPKPIDDEEGTGMDQEHTRSSSPGQRVRTAMNGKEKNAVIKLGESQLSSIWAANSLAFPLQNSKQCSSTSDEGVSLRYRGVTCSTKASKGEPSELSPPSVSRGLTHASAQRHSAHNRRNSRVTERSATADRRPLEDGAGDAGSQHPPGGSGAWTLSRRTRDGLHCRVTEQHICKTVKTLEWGQHGPREVVEYLPLQVYKARPRSSLTDRHCYSLDRLWHNSHQSALRPKS